MLIKKRLQYVEWLYTGTKTTRMLVIQLIPGNKKAGESVGGNIVDYNSLNKRALSHTTRQQGLKTFKDVKGEKK